MALIRRNDGYDYNGKYKMSSLSQFKQAEKRLAAKKQALEDMKNEYDLIEQQTFYTYKDNIHYSLLDQSNTIQECSKWLRMLSKNQDDHGNKLDRRKKYKEKETYSWYTDYVAKILDIEYMHDIKFIDFNFGQATEIQFTYRDHQWQLFIPHINNIKLFAYQIYGAGVFKLGLIHKDKDSTCGWTHFGDTYEEDELKDIMAAGIEKYCQ